jgi:hypothetical protein
VHGVADTNAPALAARLLHLLHHWAHAADDELHTATVALVAHLQHAAAQHRY